MDVLHVLHKTAHMIYSTLTVENMHYRYHMYYSHIADNINACHKSLKYILDTTCHIKIQTCSTCHSKHITCYIHIIYPSTPHYITAQNIPTYIEQSSLSPPKPIWAICSTGLPQPISYYIYHTHTHCSYTSIKSTLTTHNISLQDRLQTLSIPQDTICIHFPKYQTTHIPFFHNILLNFPNVEGTRYTTYIHTYIPYLQNIQITHRTYNLYKKTPTQFSKLILHKISHLHIHPSYIPTCMPHVINISHTHKPHFLSTYIST